MNESHRKGSDLDQPFPPYSLLIPSSFSSDTPSTTPSTTLGMTFVAVNQVQEEPEKTRGKENIYELIERPQGNYATALKAQAEGAHEEAIEALLDLIDDNAVQIIRKRVSLNRMS